MTMIVRIAGFLVQEKLKVRFTIFILVMQSMAELILLDTAQKIQSIYLFRIF